MMETSPLRSNAKPELQPMAQAIQAAMAGKGFFNIASLTRALDMKAGQIGTVSNWVHGVNRVGAHYLPRVQNLLGLSDEVLAAGIDPKPAKPPKRRRRKAHKPDHSQRPDRVAGGANGQQVAPAVTSPTAETFAVSLRSDATISIEFKAVLTFLAAQRLIKQLTLGGHAVSSFSLETL